MNKPACPFVIAIMLAAALLGCGKDENRRPLILDVGTQPATRKADEQQLRLGPAHQFTQENSHVKAGTEDLHALSSDSTSSNKPTRRMSLRDIGSRYATSVATIIWSEPSGPVSKSASGFLVGGRFLVTTHSALAGDYGSSTCLLEFANGDIIEATWGHVVIADAAKDVAVLRLPDELESYERAGEKMEHQGSNARVENLPPSVDLGDGLPDVGDPVVVVGSPEGFAGTVSEGTVSAVRTSPHGMATLQVSGTALPGASGGPVFTLDGRVCAMTLPQADGQALVNTAAPLALSVPELMAAELGDDSLLHYWASDIVTSAERQYVEQTISEVAASLMRDLEVVLESMESGAVPTGYSRSGIESVAKRYSRRDVAEVLYAMQTRQEDLLREGAPFIEGRWRAALRIADMGKGGLSDAGVFWPPSEIVDKVAGLRWIDTKNTEVAKGIGDIGQRVTIWREWEVLETNPRDELLVYHVTQRAVQEWATTDLKYGRLLEMSAAFIKKYRERLVALADTNDEWVKYEAYWKLREACDLVVGNCVGAGKSFDRRVEAMAKQESAFDADGINLFAVIKRAVASETVGSEDARELARKRVQWLTEMSPQSWPPSASHIELVSLVRTLCLEATCCLDAAFAASSEGQSEGKEELRRLRELISRRENESAAWLDRFLGR